MYRLVGCKIGRNVFIGMKCYMDDVDPEKTTIGNDVTISYDCYFTVHGRNQTHTEIRIEDGSYLGVRVNVVSGKDGVTIGRGYIVGAGALVLRSIPDHCIAAGVPARVLKENKNSKPADSETPCRDDS